MLKKLYLSAAVWAGLGLTAGLYYREFTKISRFSGITQLSVAHTHALALGMIVLLAVLALARAFTLDAAGVRIFVWVYNIGLAVTFGMLVFKGTLQVLAHPLASSSALAGVAGIGHITLTGAIIWLFLVLGRAVTSAEAEHVGAEHVGAGQA